jgi:hypothetical protein
MSTQWMQIAVVGTILTIGGPVLGRSAIVADQERHV